MLEKSVEAAFGAVLCLDVQVTPLLPAVDELDDLAGVAQRLENGDLLKPGFAFPDAMEWDANLLDRVDPSGLRA